MSRRILQDNKSKGTSKTTRIDKAGHATVIVRECIAVSVHHILLSLAPVIVQRVRHRPHPLAIAAVSLWWTFRVTGTLPHLVIRIAEQRLGRPNVPSWAVLVLFHLAGRFGAMYVTSRHVPELEISWKLIVESLPMDCLRMTVFTVAILVVPVLIQVNRIAFPGWWLLFLLLIPTNEENEITPRYPPIIYYALLHVLSGFLAGRWIQWSFPDDPGSRATIPLS